MSQKLNRNGQDLASSPSENPERLGYLRNRGLALALLAANGCGVGGIAEAVRPNDPTATKAMGEKTCSVPEDQSNPLVVDWKGHHRDALEIAMKDGIAVVSYDCDSLRLLPNCKMDGDYEFKPTSNREKLIRLKNADQIKANLPTSGQRLGVDLEAGMKRGATLDINLRTIGRVVTTRSGVSRELLKGKCEEATHIVRAATMGAFTMKTNTLGAVGAGVGIMEAEASAASSSEKTVNMSSGEMNACKESFVDGKPPEQCSTPVRLHLEPIEGDNTDQTAFSTLPKTEETDDTQASSHNFGVMGSFAYRRIWPQEELTQGNVINGGAGITYTPGHVPLSLELEGGALAVLNGGIAPHYTEAINSSATGYLSAGFSLLPKLSEAVGIRARAKGGYIFTGGGCATLDVGPTFFLGKDNPFMIDIGASAGYFNYGQPKGDNPTAPRLEDPVLRGFSFGGYTSFGYVFR